MLGEQWQDLTADAVEEMCRQAAKGAKILQMLLPRRACRLLDQVRDPALVADVVLAMDPPATAGACSAACTTGTPPPPSARWPPPIPARRASWSPPCRRIRPYAP
ncbi:hypothetical protein GCM10020001_063620 [Nonomuraea salmonea]